MKTRATLANECSSNNQLIDGLSIFDTDETDCYLLDFLSLCAEARIGRLAGRVKHSFMYEGQPDNKRIVLFVYSPSIRFSRVSGGISCWRASDTSIEPSLTDAKDVLSRGSSALRSEEKEKGWVDFTNRFSTFR